MSYNDAGIFMSIDIPYVNCYTGQVTLLNSNSYTYNNNSNFTVVTGYPAVCMDDEFIPICDTAKPGPTETRIGCIFTTNYTSKSQ